MLKMIRIHLHNYAKLRIGRGEPSDCKTSEDTHEDPGKIGPQHPLGFCKRRLNGDP
jgi:hypothetical protein